MSEKMWEELAPYYDVFYQWKDYRAESRRVDDLIRRHKKSPGNSLLDVACGTGGHLEFLHKGHDCTGLDLNAGMLKVARKKLPGVPLHRADMMSFELGRQFDVVVCLFSAIAYARTLANLRRVLRCFARHLVPGGLLIVEPFVERAHYQAGLVHGATMSSDGVVVSRMNVTRRRGSLAVLDFHYLVGTSKGVRYFQDLHEVALFDSDRFLALLGETGFRARILKNGLMKNRGLYLGVKKARE